ncbi:hypothetical protein KP509_27G031700 [Ceratopteris richardii]|uniref:UDP-glycosyltransferases domain-containing protein n=1 Tax=Ceratopteris richardii TaxID=49495 RepID=A0A8T2RGZ4_CERRI|nr:hypothetical protein KP509_27G031700 [Ceratopteris richardii]
MARNLLKLILELQGQGDRHPFCLISDSFAPWTVPVAQQAGIPRIEFWISNALAYLLILSLPSLLRDKVFPETGEEDEAKPTWKRKSPLMLTNIPCMPAISSELLPPEIRFDNGSKPFLRLFQDMCFCATLSYRCLIYSTSALEPDAFRGLQSMGLSVRPIGGCLLHDSISENASRVSASEDVKKNECLVWLDKQATSSVIYVAFGSVVDLIAADVEELAIGLEASGHAFLWALRWEGEAIEAVNGLAERTTGRGMVTGWAPQTEILSHAAIGAFLSHCGWNSVMESLLEGVPLLCCPFFGDHRSNAWYLVEVWRVGLELERSSDGGLRREYVESGVKVLLETPQGSAARQKAKEIMVSLREEAKQGSEAFTNLQSLYDDIKQVMSNPS